MQSIPWHRVLQVLAVVFMLVSVAWYIYDPGFDPLLTLLSGIITGIGSFFAPTGEPQPNRISTTAINNVAITGNNNVQQVTQSGHNVNAPNSKLTAGGNISDAIVSDSISIDKLIIQSEAHKAQQLPHEIPSPPADFTGRDYELQELLEHFDHGVTITGLRGMGGIGKTALASKLAKDLADRYPDGQMFVELKGMDPKPLTSAEAMAHVIRAYNSEAQLPESEPELSAAYHTTLHGKRALLLLDNAADDQQIRPLLPPDTCGVIVTSRKKIAFQGLMPIDLDTLKPDKAVELLLKIRRPNLPPIVPPQEEEYWKEIAKLCGYLPLALRAAGSFLANRPDISLDHYIKELSDERTRLKLIGKEGVDLDVEASFNLSYCRLLTETAQVFRMLSVFLADFDAKAEEIVCQDERHKHLSELVSWNLVEYHEDKGRYHLHDLARIFAATRLAADGDNACFKVYLRHAEYYKNVLSDAADLYEKGGENVLAGLKLFDLELPNIRVGQAWIESVTLQTDRMGAMEINSQIKNALRLCSIYPNTGAYVLLLRLHPQERIRWLETALIAARKLEDSEVERATLGNLGIAYSNLSKFHKAIEFYEQYLAIGKKIGDQKGEGASMGNIGIAYYKLGEYRKAIEFHEQHLSIARKIGSQRDEGNALCNLGLAYSGFGEHHKAIELYKQALIIHREMGDIEGEGGDLYNLGIAFDKIGESVQAIDCAKSALHIFEQMENPFAEKIRQKLTKWQG